MLSLSAVHKSFDRHAAVAGLSMDVARGDIVALLGPSGCGKTTTLRMIAGFERPDAGVITLDGAVIDRLAPYERSVGIVFQDYALFPHMSVMQNVMFGPRQRGVAARAAQERAVRYLELVRMGGFAARSPATLSGGQQQRVAVARALATEPAVLLLDEPLSALDAKLRTELRAELRAILVATGCATVIVTHDQEEAMSLADHVCVMNQGRIEQIGAPATIYHQPATRFVAGFVGRANFIAGRVEPDGFRSDNGLLLKLSGVAAPAGPTELMIRPEAIRLSRGDDPFGMILLDGIITHSLFLGMDREIGFRLRDGTALSMLVRGKAALPPAPDTRIRVCFEPSDIVWIPRTPG
jgi:putative spermidine/putrescine transport system ATP-binding protein